MRTNNIMRSRLGHATLFMLFLLYANSIFCQNSTSESNEDWLQKTAWQKTKEPASYFKFSKKFIELFNGDEMAKVLEVSSGALKSEIDPQKFIDFLNFFKRDFGNIDSLQFKYFDKRNQRTNPVDMAVYTLTFDRGTKWELRIKLNGNGKLDKYIITDNNFNESAPLKFSQLEMSLPFNEDKTWFVLWGGEIHEDNYHVVSKAQKNAIDFVIKNPYSNRTYKNDGTKNSDYYAYDQQLFAPVKGTIVKVIDTVPDNTPGVMNPKNLTGNTVIIKNGSEYVLLAHLKKNSIVVKEGDVIERGILLGNCGNSGNSSEAHLHMQIMDQQELRGASGLKMFFDKLKLNFVSTTNHYSPVRGNYISKL